MKKSTQKTIDALIRKARGEDKTRMPSIVSIHNMLDDLGFNHWFYETQNICETRSGNNVYVNNRWEGKKGYEIKMDGIPRLDTSDSYYSWNTWSYARSIIRFLNEKGYTDCDEFKNWH